MSEQVSPINGLGSCCGAGAIGGGAPAALRYVMWSRSSTSLKAANLSNAALNQGFEPGSQLLAADYCKNAR